MNLKVKKKYTFKIKICLALLGVMLLVYSYITSIFNFVQAQDNPIQNTKSTLNCPTYITKIANDYFIVDCYNNQILYSENLSLPVSQWYVMTNQFKMGHSIAGDGKFYLIDDTENHKVKVFQKTGNVFVLTQTFDQIGTRPHYSFYDEPSKTFYVLSSMTGEMFLFKASGKGQQIELTEVKEIESLKNVYVRSFTVLQDKIYFVSSNMNSKITIVNKNTFALEEEIAVPEEMAGMVALQKYGDYFYITVSTDAKGNQDYGTILRTKDLSQLMHYDYENILYHFAPFQTSAVVPYFMAHFDNKFYLTESKDLSCIWQFELVNNEIIGTKKIL